MKLKLYIKISIVNEKDKIVPAGITMDFGEIQINGDITYEEIVQRINKETLLEYLQINHILTPNEIEFITKEEYQKLFPGDADAAEEIKED